MSRLDLTRILQDAARNSRTAMDNLAPFDLSASERDTGPYFAGNAHERRQITTISGTLTEVLGRIQIYVRSTLGKWQKRDETISLREPRISVVYDYQYNQTFPLRPHTLRGWWNAQVETRKNRKGAVVKNVPYEVELRLVIEQTASALVQVEAVLSEKIDPRDSLIDFPIGHHFWAPSIIHSEPWFDDLLASVRGHA